MTTERERSSAAECWQLISMGALPPAVSIGKAGQPCWDLGSLVEFFALPLDAVRDALAVKAAATAADAAHTRHAPPPPDGGALRGEKISAPKGPPRPRVGLKIRKDGVYYPPR